MIFNSVNPHVHLKQFNSVGIKVNSVNLHVGFLLPINTAKGPTPANKSTTVSPSCTSDGHPFMFMGEPWRKVCFSYVNVVLAAEFSVDGLSFVFASDKIVVADAKDSADVACFGKDGCDVFLGLQDCFTDYVLISFEFGWDVNNHYVADYVERLRNFSKQFRRQIVFENLR